MKSELIPRPRGRPQDKKDRQDKKDIPMHGAMALFETARTDVKVMHKETAAPRAA